MWTPTPPRPSSRTVRSRLRAYFALSSVPSASITVLEEFDLGIVSGIPLPLSLPFLASFALAMSETRARSKHESESATRAPRLYPERKKKKKILDRGARRFWSGRIRLSATGSRDGSLYALCDRSRINFRQNARHSHASPVRADRSRDCFAYYYFTPLPLPRPLLSSPPFRPAWHPDGERNGTFRVSREREISARSDNVARAEKIARGNDRRRHLMPPTRD